MKSYTRKQVDEAMATCSAVIPKYARDSVLEKLDTPEPEKSFVENLRETFNYSNEWDKAQAQAQLIEEMVDRKIKEALK